VDYADRLVARLPDPPSWLAAFAAWVAPIQHPSSAVGLLRRLGTLLAHGDVPPPVLLDRCRGDGRFVGSLAKALGGFFLEIGLTLPDDRSERLAQARRERLLATIPGPLRPAVSTFADVQLAARDRARRVGTAMRSHDTIEINLAAARDLARHLADASTAGSRSRSETSRRSWPASRVCVPADCPACAPSFDTAEPSE
jgi:hypothetical protein